MTRTKIYNKLKAAYGSDFATEFCEMMFDQDAYKHELLAYCKKCGIKFKEVERKIGVQRN